MSFLLALTTQTESAIPRPEHPRPDFGRTQWLSLNGSWQFCFDPDDRGLQESWYQPGKGTYDLRITVPFPWESKASGIERPDYDGIAWYRRQFAVPSRWKGKRVHLCFGAVDWQATVWLNGREVGSHEGGYSEFRFDVTDHLEVGVPNHLVVRVRDVTDPETPIGKQVPTWYTSTSGIWQPVWLETTGSTWIEKIRIWSESDAQHRPTGAVRFEVRVAQAVRQPSRLVVQSKDRSFEPLALTRSADSFRGTLKLRAPRLWTPEQPHLYPIRLVLRDEADRELDTVHTYFGVRTIAWALPKGKDYCRILLNGEPIFTNGALDQSFNPEGIYTAPSDAYMKRDIELAKKAGFDMLRIHIKAEEPRRLYWADKLGILIQADIPCFYQVSEAARQRFEKTMRDQIERDFNHPSIYAWTLFNEEWGLWNLASQPRQHRVEWVEKMFRVAKQLDPTRLIHDNSGWSHLITDLNSFHWYGRDVDGFREAYRRVDEREIRPGSTWNYIENRQQRGEPFIANEYGYVAAGDGDGDWSWGTLAATNALRGLRSLCGLTYTELTDIEWEHNGVYNYDRTPKETGFEAWCPGMRVSDLFSSDFLVLDTPAIKRVQPGDTAMVPLLVSHFSTKSLDNAVVEWRAEFLGADGTSRLLRHDRIPLPEVSKAELTPLGEISFGLPQEPGIATLSTVLKGPGGRSIHHNYTQWLVGDPAAIPRTETRTNTLVLRFVPNDWSHSEFTGRSAPEVAIRGKHYGTGSGVVRYRLPLPAGLPLAELVGLRLQCEVAAKAGREKVDWPSRTNPQDYPQTDGKKHPSEVVVRIAGAKLTTWRLPDDPADARGVLSHWAGIERGSYGYLMSAQAEGEVLETIRENIARTGFLEIELAVPPSSGGGMAIYGAQMGMYPMDPTVTLSFARPLDPTFSERQAATDR